MIERFHHICIAVKDIEEALGDLVERLGLPKVEIVEVESQAVKACLIPIGDGELELIQPTNPETGVARFLDSRGESFHHVCFQVHDVDQALQTLETRGCQLIDKKGRPGLAGLVGFLHPRSTKGVLVELAQPVHSH
jgi:methylmalonyl-CoA/ethylmalonyl-CoA epimerase